MKKPRRIFRVGVAKLAHREIERAPKAYGPQFVKKFRFTIPRLETIPRIETIPRFETISRFETIPRFETITSSKPFRDSKPLRVRNHSEIETIPRSDSKVLWYWKPLRHHSNLTNNLVFRISCDLTRGCYQVKYKPMKQVCGPVQTNNIFTVYWCTLFINT